tara:strand:- start:2042 stop:2425 length:384 start_codon:yes stop_codon:yes gene_type:complete
MAIKEKKIPSPSEIANTIERETVNTPQPSPQVSPNDKIAPNSLTDKILDFTTEEVAKIQQLQSDMQNVLFQFGQLKINEIKIKEQGVLLQNQLTSLEKAEADLAKSLTDKYGKGSLDIETGRFTPLK